MEDPQTALAKFSPGEFNRLFPSETVVDNLGRFQEAKVEQVRLNPEEGAGDVYMERRVKKLALTKTALDKIAFAGGLSCHPTLSRVEERTANYCRFTAVGIMKKADGTPYLVKRTKEIDLEIEQERDRDRYTGYADEDIRKGRLKKEQREDWIETKVRRDYLQARENMVQNAESKAWNRVVRACFGIKSSYTAQEIAKPFVVVRFDTAFDPKDPVVSAMLMTQAQTAIGQIFDVGSALAPPPAGYEPAPALPVPPTTSTTPEPTFADDLDNGPDPTPEPEPDPMSEFEKAKIEYVEANFERPLGDLKSEFVDLIKATRYQKADDPMEFILDWKKSNDMSNADKRRARAGILFEAIRYAEGDKSANPATS